MWNAVRLRSGIKVAFNAAHSELACFFAQGGEQMLTAKIGSHCKVLCCPMLV